MVRIRSTGQPAGSAADGVGVSEVQGQLRAQPVGAGEGIAESVSSSRFNVLWVQLVGFFANWFQKIHSRPPRRLRVSETLSLGEKRQLLLVECGDRQLLIGAAGNFLATLAELRPPTDANEKVRAKRE